jgi:hypothetical protein
MEVSEPNGVQESATNSAGLTDANKSALHFLLGTQRMIMEETAFTAVAALDRIRTETHLFGEFASKLAGSHSVHDWMAMGQECAQHQLEFVRRECDRMLRHSERLIDAASAVMSNRS